MIYDSISCFLSVIPETGKLLALDVGYKRIGFACTDHLRIIASPICVYKRSNKENDIQYITDLCNAKQSVGLIVGIPINHLYDHENKITTKIRNFVKILTRNLNLPIYLQDESFSTESAVNILNESNMSRRKKQQIDDKVAASFILQNFLENAALSQINNLSNST